MIHVICDKDSWTELMTVVRPQQRFYDPDEINPDLKDKHGMPILADANGLRFHIYPPGKEAKRS